MAEQFFKVKQDPKKWADARGQCHNIVTKLPWQKSTISVGTIKVKGRKSWGSLDPIWKNEVIYYNTAIKPLTATLQRIVIHHTNNSQTIKQNEQKQQAKGYAALGYHFFIDRSGEIYEGRPIEVMGSHAGAGKVSGPLNDPDWGSIGIVLQGDYHHADDIIFSSIEAKKQMNSLEKLIKALSKKYQINRLLMHKEVERAGTPTDCPGDYMAPKIEALRKKLGMRGK